MPAQVATTFWTDVLDRLRSEAPGLFRDWFYDLAAGDLEHGVLEIRPRNRQQAAYLTTNCIPRLAEIAQLATGRLVTVRVLEPIGAATVEPAPEIEFALEPDFTFSRFYGCPENQLALGAASAVAHSPGGPHNPLLIIGPGGTGKTHLLQSIAHMVADTCASTPVAWRYRTVEAFVAEYMQAAEEGWDERFQDGYESLDLLLLDDVEHLAGRERSQEALFHIIVSLLDGGRQIVLACSIPPQEIAGLAPRLASRFACGLVAPLDTLCLESRVSMLRKLSADRGLGLTDGAAAVIAERTLAPGELVSAINRVIAASVVRGGPIEAEFARQVLDARPGIAVEVLLRAAAARLDVPGENLTQKRQPRSRKTARELAMHLVKRHTALSLPETASLFEIPTAELVDTLRRVGDEVSRDSKLAALLDEIAVEAKNADS